AIIAAIVIVSSTVLAFITKEENTTIAWVQNAQFINSTYTMKDIVENPTYFSHTSWKNVTYDGASEFDNYVMYEGTYSEHGVKIHLRTIFQVFGEAHFNVVEFNIDGDARDIYEWDLLIVDIVDKMKGNN